MTAPRPWGFTPRPAGGSDGRLYCVTPDCGAVILPDGTRRFTHVQECKTQLYDDYPDSAIAKGLRAVAKAEGRS